MALRDNHPQKNNYSKIKAYKNTPYISQSFLSNSLTYTSWQIEPNYLPICKKRIFKNNIKNSMDKNNHNPTSQHMNFHITFQRYSIAKLLNYRA